MHTGSRIALCRRQRTKANSIELVKALERLKRSFGKSGTLPDSAGWQPASRDKLEAYPPRVRALSPRTAFIKRVSVTVTLQPRDGSLREFRESRSEISNVDNASETFAHR